MWDWSTSKAPAQGNLNQRDARAVEAQNQGVTPLRRDIRPVPVYRDPRSSTWAAPQPSYPQQPYPPQQPYAPYPQQPYMPAYPAPYPQQQAYAPQPYPQQQAYAPQPYPQQQAYAPQPYPQQQAYAPQPYPQQQPAPLQSQVDNVPTIESYSEPQPTQAVEATGDRSMWEWQLSQLDLPNMELQEVNFVMLNAQWKLELRKAFKRARRDFLKYVGYHNVNELMAIGLSEDDIRKIKKGKACENVNVHVKIPFDYGGTNDFSNLILMQTHPFHADLHKIIDLQVSHQQKGGLPKKLFVPVPSGKVYVPGDIVLSSGGKTKHDRSVYAGFLESTFEQIAERSAMDR